MNFDDLNLTIRMVHPEIRYLVDYQVKGSMFLLPIDASGLVTAKGCEWFLLGKIFDQ
jgi:hypothetical protein